MSWSASSRTGALAAGLALCSAWLVATASGGARLPGSSAALPALGGPAAAVVAVLVLAVLFFLAELCLLHVEVRREAYSVTLAGIPLALGLLLCDSRELVAARLIGSAAAFVVQRAALLKVGYNLASYAFEAAAGVALLHLLLAPEPVLSARLALVCGAVLLSVDQLMSVLVVQVISWHQGRRLTVLQMAEVHLPALVCTSLSASTAYGVLLLGSHGPVGAVVLTVLAGSAALVYRNLQVLHRRHRALAQVHDFVALNDQDTPPDELAETMLRKIRELLRASSAELLLGEQDARLHLRVGEDDVVVEGRGNRAGDLPAAGRPLADGPLLLHKRTRNRTERAWLASRGVADAVAVPLPAPDGTRSAGVLAVYDRLGGTGSFTLEDQTLLATLAGCLAVAVDSSRRREQLRYEATHDVLTGLGNRALLNSAILRHLQAVPAPAAVLILDLDRFKEVNDTLGHHVGDDLLKVLAHRLVTTLPAGSTVARLGGDEFAALVGDLGPDAAAGAAEAARLGHAVAQALVAPVELREATLTIRASIGLALVEPAPGSPVRDTTACLSTAAELLRHADTAMYAAKERQATVLVYTAELDRGRAERLALLADLHLALERDELHVVYQPKLDLGTGQITSVEALVRWQHPALGLLSPDTFIPLAEANGLIAPLTRIVLAEALRQCAAWRASGLDLTVAVNLSARTVNDPDLPERISAALVTAGVPATRLVLEVTESAVMDDPARAVTILERIAAIGVGLSLDDFGTGYSSLSYLQQLPVQEVKIDRSFVTGLTAGNERSRVLVRSIIGLGTGLGLRVVAEGVEDAATLDLLRELGCHLAQGYHVSRPLPGEELTTRLQTDRAGQRRLRAVAG